MCDCRAVVVSSTSRSRRSFRSSDNRWLHKRRYIADGNDEGRDSSNRRGPRRVTYRANCLVYDTCWAPSTFDCSRNGRGPPRRRSFSGVTNASKVPSLREDPFARSRDRVPYRRGCFTWNLTDKGELKAQFFQQNWKGGGKFTEGETRHDVALARHRVVSRLAAWREHAIVWGNTPRRSSLHHLFRTAIKCASPSVPLRAERETSTTGNHARTRI